MKLDINPRGNGACPLCALVDDCRIRGELAAGVDKRLAEAPMEIVIYSCPYFSERADS